MRESDDEIEQDGIARAREQAETADLVVEVCDVSQPSGPRIEVSCPHRLLVLNKCDLPQAEGWSELEGIRVSCVSGEGVEDLVAAIQDEFSFSPGVWGQEAVAINARHQACLRRAEGALEHSREQLEGGVNIEFVAVDLREALDAVGEVAGRVDADEILGEIFGSFCIGK